MNNKLLYKQEYDKLHIDEKNKLLQKIADYYGFSIKEYTTFEKDGTTLYTAVFLYNDIEFVFIPGAKSISLGWKKNINGKAEDKKLISYIKNIMFDFFLSSLEDNHKYFKYRFYSSMEELEKDLSEKEYTSLDKFLTKMTMEYIDDNTSVLKKIDIAPMLVERKSESLNWKFTKEIPSDAIADSPLYFKIYQEIIKSGKSYIIKEKKTKTKVIKKVKYVIHNKGLRLYNYQDFNHNEIIFYYKTMGYNIPDCNQWEYIASTGINTLYTDDNILYKNSPVNTPNGFGLYICNNVYEPEIISDNAYNYKGGDGGFYNTYISNYLTNFSLSPYHNTKAGKYNYTDFSGLYARKIIKINFKMQFHPKINKKNINKFISDNLETKNYDAIIYAVNSVKNEGISFINGCKVIEIYHIEGFINQSLTLVNKYMDEGRYHPEFLYLAGYTFFRLQDLKKASNLLKKAVTIKRNMPECYQLLSYIYHKTNLTANLEQAFHHLYVLDQDIAGGMVPILFPKGLNLQILDYEDLWNQFSQNIAGEFDQLENKSTNTVVNEVVLLNACIEVIIKNGISEYIQHILSSANEYILNIFQKIDNSPYISDDEINLTHSDFTTATEEYNACKNIFYEINSIKINEADSEYLQNLTNTFFDCFPALITFAYIHYSNSRLFEASILFDPEFTFCSKLYKERQIPIEITDKLRSMLEEFIVNITTNIYTYYQLNNMIGNILKTVNNITSKYKNNDHNVYLIEQSMLHDITYILKWFNINININTAS